MPFTMFCALWFRCAQMGKAARIAVLAYNTMRALCGTYCAFAPYKKTLELMHARLYTRYKYNILLYILL